MFRAAAFTAAFLGLCAFAFAQLAVPQLTGRVVDLAGILNPAVEKTITEVSLAHEQATGEQIAVLTIPALEGEVLENYSLKVARRWGLGQSGEDNGALLLIARDDRKIRIEVGYGLEGRLTDIQSGLIIRRAITPDFRNGKFGDGVLKGVRSMVSVLGGNPLAEPAPDSQRGRDNPLGAVMFFIIFGLFFFGPVFLSILVRQFGRKIKPGHYRWLGFETGPNSPRGKRRAARRGGVFYGGSGGGGWGSGGGGFSGGGGGFGGGGASGGW